MMRNDSNVFGLKTAKRNILLKIEKYKVTRSKGLFYYLLSAADVMHNIYIRKINKETNSKGTCAQPE